MEENPIAMEDIRDDKYGKLHLIMDTSTLPQGSPSQVTESANPGDRPRHKGGKAPDRENVLITWAEEKEEWLADQAAEEACKKFLIDRIGELHFKPLKDRRTGYKGVSLERFVEHIIDKYQAEPEERQKVKDTMAEKWDANEHIEHMYDLITEGMEMLADMNG